MQETRRYKLLKENIVSGTVFVWRDKDGNRPGKNNLNQSGLEAIAALFLELPASNAIYLALGTGETAAADGNVKLEAEGYRKILTSKTRNLNEVRLRFFLLTSEANGEWSEMGVMLAGTEGQWPEPKPDSTPGGIRKASNRP